MQYLALIATDDQPGSPPEAEHELDDWLAEGERRGLRLRGDVLAPRDAATTVRVRDGELLLVDGPYTESKEWIVGYDLLECADLQEAIDYMSRHPMARRGRIELRAVTSLSS